MIFMNPGLEGIQCSIQISWGLFIFAKPSCLAPITSPYWMFPMERRRKKNYKDKYSKNSFIRLIIEFKSKRLPLNKWTCSFV